MVEDLTVAYGSSLSNSPNWQENEQRLYDCCCDAISRFTKEHPGIEVSFLGFDSEPCYGYVLIGFDTPENQRKVATEQQDYEVMNRRRQFCIGDICSGDAWRDADYFINQAQSYAFSPSTGYFEYSEFANCQFDEWEEFSNSFNDQLPDENAPDFEQRENELIDEYSKYLEGNVLLLFWRVFDRLIHDGRLSSLTQASPMRLGFNFHEQDTITVLHILNL